MIATESPWPSAPERPAPERPAPERPHAVRPPLNRFHADPRSPGPRLFVSGPARQLLQRRARDRQIPLSTLAAELALPRRTVTRVLASEWLPWHTADRLAVALGRHPSELWPDWFEASPGAPKGG
ncbi:MAG: hypothetical protein NVS3B26_17480 [Mycobacteriales bacterium]